MAVVCDVVTAAANTTTGNQTFTSSTMGVAPKAAIIICTSATAADTNTNHIQFSYGFTDGTNQRCITVRSKDANNSMLADYRGASDEVIMLLNTGNNNVNGEANIVSFGTNTVTINWANPPGSAFLVTVIMIGGSDFSATVGELPGASINEDSTFKKNLGFKADVVHFLSSFSTAPFADSTTVSGRLGLGWASRDTADDSGDQNRSMNWWLNDGSADGDPRMRITNAACINGSTSGTVALQVDPATASQFESDGFTVTARNGTWTNDVGFLAMSFGGVNDFKVWEFSTPTATPPTTSTDSGPGFKPEFVMYLTHHVQTVNTEILDLDAGCFGVSAFTADNERHCVAMEEDPPATTNNACSSGSSAVLLPLHDQTAAYDADFSSMAATGPELTWNDNETDAARLWIGFAIEEDVAGANAIPMAGHEYRMRR
jgi:hypothetical protein